MAASLRAQAPDLTRVLRTFDFEERRLGNVEDLPMNWMKVEGSGLPHYVNARLSNDRAHSGDYSFRYDLNGGSLLYRYGENRIRVRADAHYRVEAWVKTTVLQNARARVTAYFVDQDSRVLADSITHSPLYAATQAEENWRKLSVELSANEQAAYLVLELGLLQPEHYSTRSLGQRTLFTQDIRGTAWFDDVQVSQVPQVNLTTDRPGNLFRKGDELQLTAMVNDRVTEDLAAQLVIKDAAQRLVYQRSGALDMSAARSLGEGRKRMTLMLPELTPGWYEASLVMTSRGQFVGSQALHFVLLADDGTNVDPDPRFGVIATDLPFDGWSDLPKILPFLAAGRVKLAVWNTEGDIEQVDPGAFDSLLEELSKLNIVPTACLAGLPPQVARAVGVDEQDRRSSTGGWLKLLRSDKGTWQPQLAYLVARHANHLDRWQLGADGSDAFVNDPKMRDVYAMIYREFAALVQRPDLAMPWPAWFELTSAAPDAAPERLPSTVALSIPGAVLPAQIPLYMQDISRVDGRKLSVTLQPLDAQDYDRDVRIRDFAQRIIYALAAGAERIDVPLPFTVRHEGDQLVRQPDEMLLVLRTLISTLSGATFKGKVPIAEGVEAFLFEKEGKGILVLWDRGIQGGIKELALELGERPLRLDLWGNVTPLLRSRPMAATPGSSLNERRAAHSGALQMNIDPMPVLLVDIDGALAQFRASVGVDRPLVESSFEPHVRKLHFTNPYKQAIGGQVKLRAPSGWRLNPPTITFTLNPNETIEREVTIEFPYNSYAGPKEISAEFALQADRNVEFTVPIMLNLGLSDVGMQSLALRDGTDVIVQQMISNYSDHPIDYTAFAIFPGQARQERLVTNLGPGKTTIKRYRFTNVKIEQAIKVRSGVKELTGTRILNDEVPVQ